MPRFRVHLAAGALALLAAASPLTAGSWTRLGPFGGQVTSLAIDPARPDTLYAATFSATFKSTDAGASWRALPGAPGGGLLAIDPSRPTTLYATAQDVFTRAIWKSTDAGATWKASDRGLPFHPGAHRPGALALDPARPSRLYLGVGGQGVWKSEDSGATWRQANQGFRAGGRTLISALAVASRPSGTAYAGTYATGVYKTTNAGRSWTQLRNGLPERYVAALAVAPSDPRTVYASLRQGIYRSADGGASWQPAGAPLPASAPAAALAVHPRQPGTVYAGSQAGGLFKTTDGGASWARVERTGEAGVLSLAIHPRTPQVVYAGMFPGATAIGGVLRTPDGGATWRPRSRGLSDLQAFNVAADPGHPGVLLAGTPGPGLFRTLNQGSNWARTSLGFPTANPSGVRVADVFATAASTFYAVLEEGSLWRTADAGASWTRVPLPAGQLSYARRDPEDPDVLYAVLATGLFRSADGGASWAPLTSPPLDCGVWELTAAPSSSGPSLLYAGGAVSKGTGGCGAATQARIFRSLDGGLTWLPTAGDLPGEAASTIVVDPVDPHILYAGLGVSLITAPQNGVWKSEDAGASWREAGPELRFKPIADLAVSPVPGRLYAIADGVVFRSDDGGESWRDASHGLAALFASRLLLDPHDPDRLYAAATSGVWVLEEAE